MRVGLFELRDPPPGQADMVREVLAACDYPWHRILPVVRRDPDQAVIVYWDAGPQHKGEFKNTTYEIMLGTRYSGWEGNVAFTFAHELGHLVDFATLKYDEHLDLLTLMHEEDDSRYAGQPDPNNPSKPHPSSHAREHAERWPSVQPDYLFRPREAYADLFVAAFVPDMWAGRSPRFVHWTDDLAAVRDITLRRPIVTFPDVKPDRWSAKSIEKAAAAGILEGRDDGRFDPDAPVDREEFAVVLDRLGLLEPR